MIEEMALNYFRNLPKEQQKQIIKNIFSSLSEEEKLEIAELLVGKKK